MNVYRKAIWREQVKRFHGLRNQVAHLYWHGLTLIPAWISKHMTGEMRDENTYPFPQFNVCTFIVWEWMSLATLYSWLDYLSMLVITLTCVSKSKSTICSFVLLYPWASTEIYLGYANFSLLSLPMNHLAMNINETIWRKGIYILVCFYCTKVFR